jgi:hypothetical protein
MLSKQTTLDLNGPFLSFVQQPTSVSVANSGIATFIGVATATFPTQSPINPASNSGYISYQWYESDQALTDNANITGSATTTLTVSNIVSPTDNGRSFYLQADYVASAYGQSPITVGTARSTGNAVNDPISTNSVSLTVYPLVSVTTQPTSQTASQTRTATFTVSGTSNDGSAVTYQWYINNVAVNNGSNSISGAIFTVSGATSQTLSASGDTIGTYNITAKIFHPTASNSPVTSNTAIFSVVSARQIISVELVPGNGGNATLYTWNLFSQGQFSIGPGEVPAPNIMSFYASETDLDVFIDISANAGSDYGSYKGGHGGMSTIRLTLQKNIEYVITSIAQVNAGSGIFFYRKSRLIACVGGGGNAGSAGNGGDGGGVNVAGADGSGRGAGTGGSLYLPGTLPSNGIFGSITAITPKAGDTQASAPNGGRCIPCPRGDYWYNLGYSACSDLGDIQFRVANGSLSSNTAVVSRGFKAGYGIRNTAGAGLSGGGNGGNGATGGNGGNGGGGGGGGSGYTDGSVTVVSTRQGGNTTTGRIIIRSAI